MTDEAGHDVYATVHQYADQCGPVLRCANCPEWEADVDGEAIAEVVRKARDHVGEPAGLYPTVGEP